MPHSAYLSLGSNLGDRQANLQAARVGLAPSVQILRESSVYETQPWGYADQPLYLNQVLQVTTELSARQLLSYLKNLETCLGRVETFQYGPRIIDLDILLYEHLQTVSARLAIPHPHLVERAFVLVPLAEIAPDLSIPGMGKTVKELLAGVDTTTVKKL